MKDSKQMDFFPSTSSLEDTLANLSPSQVEKKNTRLWEIDSLTFKRIDALPLPKEDSSDDDETLPF